MSDAFAFAPFKMPAAGGGGSAMSSALDTINYLSKFTEMQRSARDEKRAEDARRAVAPYLEQAPTAESLGGGAAALAQFDPEGSVELHKLALGLLPKERARWGAVMEDASRMFVWVDSGETPEERGGRYNEAMDTLTQMYPDQSDQIEALRPRYTGDESGVLSSMISRLMTSEQIFSDPGEPEMLRVPPPEGETGDWEQPFAWNNVAREFTPLPGGKAVRVAEEEVITGDARWAERVLRDTHLMFQNKETISPRQAAEYRLAYSSLSRLQRYSTPEGTFETPPMDLTNFPDPSQIGGGAPLGGAEPDAPPLDAVTGSPETTDTRQRRKIAEREYGEAAVKNAGFARRMIQAEADLAAITGFDPAGVWEAVRGVTVWTMSAEQQQYQQGARVWISGLLRYDSGAAVPEDEFDRYFTTYFAQGGDSDAVIAQKTASRELQNEIMQGSSQGAYDALFPQQTMQQKYDLEG